MVLTADDFFNYLLSIASKADAKDLTPGPVGHTGYLQSLAFIPDGKRLMTGSADETVKIWDTASARPLITLWASDGPVEQVTISPDGKYLATRSATGGTQGYYQDPKDLLGLAKKRVTRSLTSDECNRYCQSPPVR